MMLIHLTVHLWMLLTVMADLLLHHDGEEIQRRFQQVAHEYLSAPSHHCYCRTLHYLHLL
jgi:hypothetical protein